jgi:hypothetical protein
MKFKKESLKIPSKCFSFNKDIIDQMMDHENKSIFNLEVPGRHDPHCKAAKAGGSIVGS